MRRAELLQAKTYLPLFGDLKFDIALAVKAVREENLLLTGDGRYRVVVHNKERIDLLIKLVLSE